MESATVELIWIPLGAGQRVVMTSGRVFETLSALIGRRPKRDLYHSALIVSDRHERVIVEMTPIVDSFGSRRGVVAEGSVGIGWLGRFRVFRYEIRRWRNGHIDDLQHATSVVAVTSDCSAAQRLLELVPAVPTPVWGRDQLRTSDMWNSNSVTSWLLARSGLDVDAVALPVGGRAPGWDAGIVVARRTTAAR